MDNDPEKLQEEMKRWKQQAKATDEDNTGLVRKMKTLKEKNANPPNNISGKSVKANPLQINSRKRRRELAKKNEHGEASDEHEDNEKPAAATRTRTDPITGMQVEVDDDKEEHDTPTPPPPPRPTRCIPSIVVEREEIVKMIKEERINFLKARTTRDGIKILTTW